MRARYMDIWDDRWLWGFAPGYPWASPLPCVYWSGWPESTGN